MKEITWKGFERKMLYDDERLDYIMSAKDMPIIQSPTIFTYSLDALLLAHFTYVPVVKGNILDLGTGNGIIPLLLSKRTKGPLFGLEIQHRLVNMAQRNIVMNHLEDQIHIIKGDLRELQDRLPQNYFEVVVANPPYFQTPNANQQNINEHKKIARHEIMCTLEDVVKAAKNYVKPGGKFSLVHRPERLTDIVSLFRQYRLEPKRMQFVYPKRHKEANILLVEGIRDGKRGLNILPPLYIYEEDDTYTKEAARIIYGK